ncbi:MAG TPA: hypothetical protein VF177_04060 [Anaerolineae bacterium]
MTLTTIITSMAHSYFRIIHRIFKMTFFPIPRLESQQAVQATYEAMPPGLCYHFDKLFTVHCLLVTVIF